MTPDEFYADLNVVMDNRTSMSDAEWVSLLMYFMRRCQHDAVLQASMTAEQRQCFEDVQNVIQQYACERN